MCVGVGGGGGGGGGGRVVSSIVELVVHWPNPELSSLTPMPQSCKSHELTLTC